MRGEHGAGRDASAGVRIAVVRLVGGTGLVASIALGGARILAAHIGAADDGDVLGEVQAEPILLEGVRGDAAAFVAYAALLVDARARLAVCIRLAAGSGFTRAVVAQQALFALGRVVAGDAPVFIAALRTAGAAGEIRRALFLGFAADRSFSARVRGRRGRCLVSLVVNSIGLALEPKESTLSPDASLART